MNKIVSGLILVAAAGSVVVWRLAGATPTSESSPAMAPSAKQASATQCAKEEQIIGALLKDFEAIDIRTLEALPARDIQRFQLPTPGIDVMRVALEETYSIDGIGTETVPLKGWIAVRHGSPRLADGFNALSWETAVTDTEFVGLQLDGESKLFGPVHITLDGSRPRPIGQVGRIDLPEAAYAKLEALGQDVSSVRPATKKSGAKRVAQVERTPTVKRSVAVSRTITTPLGDKGPGAGLRIQTLTPELSKSIRMGCCKAEVQVSIRMPSLNLSMVTATPVTWFSIVSTIPPVGETASIALEPVALISASRKVGVLESGVVKFREVVRFVPILDPKVACNGSQTPKPS